jgi:hypothetical protein
MISIKPARTLLLINFATLSLMGTPATEYPPPAGQQMPVNAGEVVVGERA